MQTGMKCSFFGSRFRALWVKNYGKLGVKFSVRVCAGGLMIGFRDLRIAVEGF